MLQSLDNRYEFKAYPRITRLKWTGRHYSSRNKNSSKSETCRFVYACESFNVALKAAMPPSGAKPETTFLNSAKVVIGSTGSDEYSR